MSYIRYPLGVRQGAPTAAMNTPTTLDEPTTPSFSPLYQQIKTLILQSLQAGEWKPGEPIPSEMDLAVRYRVSQGTVRKAIDELSAENLVVRRQGKGTFVATHAEQHVQYRFLKLVPDAGDPSTEGPAVRTIVDCKRLRASADVARALGPAHRRRGAAGAPRAGLWRRADHPRRPLAARHALQGPDGRAAARLARPDVRAVRNRVRRAHGARRRKDPRRAARCEQAQLLDVPRRCPC
jgi:DNA-binding transcriptional regulator YhcF (GntR family)